MSNIHITLTHHPANKQQVMTPLSDERSLDEVHLQHQILLTNQHRKVYCHETDKEFYNQILGNKGLQTEFSGSIVSSNRELTYHFQLVNLTSNQQGHGNHKKMFQHQQSSHFGYHHP